MNEAEWLACAEPQAMLRLVRENPDHANINCDRSERKLRLFLAACCRRVWASLGPASRLAVEAAERFADGTPMSAASALDAAAEAGSANRYSGRNEACWAAAWLCQNQALLHPDMLLRSCSVAAGYSAVSYEAVLEEMGEDAPNSVGPVSPNSVGPVSRRWQAAHDGERAAQAEVLRHCFDPFGRAALPPAVSPGDKLMLLTDPYRLVPTCSRARAAATVVLTRGTEMVVEPAGAPGTKASWPAPPSPCLTADVLRLAASLYGGDPAFSGPLADALLDAGAPEEWAEHFRAGGCPKGCSHLDALLGKE